MSFDVGSLVHARGREWVVLPESREEEDLLVLRPLGGSEDEITGIYLPLEPDVREARFPPPDPARDMGNHNSSALLREAVRLGFRSGAGPFRSLGRINVEPRPYQLVPLLMALRLDPVRLLIADDVGIGKTVEALLILREMLDRAEIRRSTVLCPPHLAEQWQEAMREQFNIDATLVLPGTVTRLERELSPGTTLFEHHPHTVVSMDYIKSERRRFEFLRVCPEFVIVDEAHTCTAGTGNRSTQMRHDLLRKLVEDEARHMVLVTATPHSGKEENFRSLLALLDPTFTELPMDLGGDENRRHRERLARHLVQRRRGDLEDYLDTHTPFPEREIAEESYQLHPEYRKILDRILEFTRERVLDPELNEHRQRVRWWSALALLRSLASSPPAAASTLRNRSAPADTETPEEADEVGRRTVLDQDEEALDGVDVTPGGQTDEDADSRDRRRLLEFAREVEKLTGDKDRKLEKATKLIDGFLKDGFSPIVFCRFIPTVHYVTEHLREYYGDKVVVEAVTGELAPAERERRVQELGNRRDRKRVLVCTDCLSEGINLQHGFDAVMHYDLSWNPTRHEQREGRVDRFGQREDVVRTLTYYGADNPVDGIVLQVLLRKHRTIHKSLGITVPVPMDTNTVVEAIFEGLLLRESAGTGQLSFDFLKEEQAKVDVQWDAAVEREKRSRTLFAQKSIRIDEVARELEATRRAQGGSEEVKHFVLTALPALGAVVSANGTARIDLSATPGGLRDATGLEGKANLAFDDPPPRDAVRVTRTHPFVAGLASYLMERSLDTGTVAGNGGDAGPARRCGLIRTKDVSMQTTLLLLRLRFHLLVRRGRGPEEPLLAEDVLTLAFRGSPESPEWLDDHETERLLQATPAANVDPGLAADRLRAMIDRVAGLQPELARRARERGEALLDAHERVRSAARTPGGTSVRVEPHLPPDLLGVYLFLPAGNGAA
jgi:superfamily II DNA or RNA helicase